MPVGLVGLMIAAMFAAAMSAERRRAERAGDGDDHRFLSASFRHDSGSDAHYLQRLEDRDDRLGAVRVRASRLYAANQGSLIEVVNRYGSLYYGSLLGVFILAILTKRATAAGAFWGMIAGMAVVLTVAFTMPWIAFLWHNVIGAVVVVVVGLVISAFR